MDIVRFDPFREMDRLQNEVNRLFEGYSSVPHHEQRDNHRSNNRLWAPSVDVAENGSELILRAELPGMKMDDIDIELIGDVLTLRGERRFDNESASENYVRVERAYGRFQRSFTLGFPVEHDDVNASYRDGILEIHLPKSAQAKPRKIAVTGAGSAETAAPVVHTTPAAAATDN